MQKRLVKKGVTIVREGKRVRPEINKNFDFTADEIERIVEVDPTALGKADAGAEDGATEAASLTPETPEPPVKETAAEKKVRLAAEKKAAKDAKGAGEGGEGGEGDDAGSGDDDL